MNTHLEHHDVLRVIGQSHTSFDDAIKNALNELADPQSGHDHHSHLEFISFKTVEFSGYLNHDSKDKSCAVIHYSVTLDVTARHTHD